MPFGAGNHTIGAMTAAVRPRRHTVHAGRIVLQVLLAVIVGGLIYGAFVNAADNLARAHIASGFHF